MWKTKLLKIVNPLLGLFLVMQFITGLSADHMSPKMFELLHFGGAFVIFCLAAAHVALNWSWVRSNFFKRSRP